MLQVSGVPLRLQALSLGGAAGLQRRSALPAAGLLEARRAGPAGGRPALMRAQTRLLLPTHRRRLSLLPGVHEREPADVLPVPEPDQSELRGGHPGAGRRVEVSWSSRRLLPDGPKEGVSNRACFSGTRDKSEGCWSCVLPPFERHFICRK